MTRMVQWCAGLLAVCFAAMVQGQTFEDVRRAAERGDAKTKYDLGVLYEKGQGVERDDAQAVRWYRSAAEQGIVSAQYRLGLSYSDGRGVEQNDAEAMRWFRGAAEQRFAPAQ